MKLPLFSLLLVFCLLLLPRIVLAQTTVGADAKAQVELNGLYETMQRGYQDKKPAVILALWSPKYTRTAYGSDDTLNRRQSESILRSQFPGNAYAPHHRFFIQSLVLLKGGKVAVATVKDFASQPDMNDTSNPRLNVSRQYLWDHTWIKTPQGWRLQKQEPAK